MFSPLACIRAPRADDARILASFGVGRLAPGQLRTHARVRVDRHPEAAGAAERALRANAAQDGEGSRDARHGAEAQMGFVVDLPHKNHSFAPAPGAATGDPSPSSAALRSLRSLSGCGRLRMTNCQLVFLSQDSECHSNREKINVAFVPPKPKEFDITCVTFCARALFGT
jgi:hypothetical protein